ncbi:hypothetical protein P153DRAFT_365506 [Dothidotthia symphoricarpi CBS 119687]|uniref:Uncharacterized protein n=1 Tax=Dothidotthia symphoricarpi CBS 119687 TaxID=1392245 RepID=A0A6A6AKA4_9PLEO|nr:uncharacterized protein P153DRAFT_365506 [Dothidotthia symphoricarpi CBS 119687]KAF2130871.1 hypothetical protein P153DRAFT_365506 [Dothidotthia symphoricarpi CBS 119687]
MAPQQQNNPPLCPTNENGVSLCAATSLIESILPTTALPTGIESFGSIPDSTLPAGTFTPAPSSTGDAQNESTSSDDSGEANSQLTSTRNTSQNGTYVMTSSTPAAASATVTATPALAQPSSKSSGNHGVSSGAVAGIAIATAIIGGALAFLAAFLLFKKRNRKQNASGGPVKYETYADSTPELIMAPKGVGVGRRDSSYVQVSQTAVPVATLARKPVQQSTPSDPLAGILPPPADEHNIQSKVAALFGDIHAHIDAYYRDVHASITSSLEPELAQFGAKDVNMAELLQDCSRPTVALKHALVAYVLGMTGPENEGDMETLFPRELSSTSVDDEVSDPNHTAASTLHRRLTVYLYSASSSHPSRSRKSWALSSNTREAAEHFSLTFFPWANPTASDQDKDEGLTHIISSTLELRIWLFGQPGVYDLVWEGAGRRGVVVSPALVRRVDGRIILEAGVISV